MNNGKKVGRPKLSGGPQFVSKTITISKDDLDFLSDQAQASPGSSVSDQIRKAVERMRIQVGKKLARVEK